MPYLLTDIRSHGTGKILYAAQGSEVQIISDHMGVLICELGGVRFPVLKSELSDMGTTQEVERVEHPLLKGFQSQLKKLGRTKYKALIGAVEDGLISQKLPDGVSKEQWLLIAKSIL